MKHACRLTGSLLTAVAAQLVIVQARGQTTAGAPDAAVGVLEEVVVTATRQTDTVNRVPISMTAVTQKSLDQLGVQSVSDLARIVPGLTLRRADANAMNPGIRGIIASAGAQTTGVYLDDTALQKRLGIGATVGNGSPFPPLFDLERVEVLRGPQGTLYGGSSEGGTVRFITPTPSLTGYSSYARAQTSTTEGGDLSYQTGIAVGGPIIDGKLGFRASLFGQHNGGYLDHYEQYTGQKALNNSNSENILAARLAFLWQVGEHLQITPAFYGYTDKLNDTASFWVNQPTATVTPARYYNAAGRATTATAADRTFAYASHTFGPYTFYGPGRAGGTLDSPSRQSLSLPTLTIDYEFANMLFKSVTSYVQDKQKGVSNQNPSNEAPALQGGVPFVAELPWFTNAFYYDNRRHGLTQELRLQSGANAAQLTWVVGAYFSTASTHAYSYNTEDLDLLARTMTGAGVVAIYGAPMLPNGVAQVRDQTIDEKELAGFGQVRYGVTARLKLTAGVRMSRSELKYAQNVFGPLAGYTTPTTGNGGIVSGVQKESPVTPRVGIDYQFNDRSLFYVSAAKGYRVGGVNLNMPDRCLAAAAAVGITTTPATYKSDTVWSYEAGAKVRLFDRAQINSSIYYIKWNNIQFNSTIAGCQAFNYVTNAAAAVSKGFDLQSNVQIVGGLSANINVAYTNAAYSADLRAPAAAGAVGGLLINKGDRLPTPPWNVQVGALYSFHLTDRFGAFARIDHQYGSSFLNSTGPGTSGYTPDVYHMPNTRYWSARMGFSDAHWDAALFIQNLTNSQDITAYTGPAAGRTGCNDLACTTYRQLNPLSRAITFRPREIGVTGTYRF